jgi:uncharacterized membrane protein
MRSAFAISNTPKAPWRRRQGGALHPAPSRLRSLKPAALPEPSAAAPSSSDGASASSWDASSGDRAGSGDRVGSRDSGNSSSSGQPRQGQGGAAPELQQQQQQQQQRLERRLQAAYDAGFKAGYLKGVQVEVDVGLALPQDPPPAPAGAAAAGSRAAAWGRDAAGRDDLLRSLVKGLVWRLFSTCVTVTVAVIVLKDLQLGDALKFGGVEFAAKFVTYVLFERLWLLV